MYATEKYVRMEAKELQTTTHDLAHDLGGDINYLHQEINDLRQQVVQLMNDLEELRSQSNA